ncbi:hypothetical protein AB0N73_01700 [Microbacterium sp. NPDC089189]|uniref:ATP-grasp domain-containing protein n=1 Tax=Microbacterium sp. NPDC089189 TaxID=3154972 RepID=UPI00341876ED
MTSSLPPRIGIVVTDLYAGDDPDRDTPLLLPALAERGVDARAVVWHADNDLGELDLLVIRSPWDYPERFAEFAAWLDRAERATRVVNSPALMRWNLDKRYLAQLEADGVPVVPTVFCETPDAAARAIAAHEPGRVVVKPTVSAGARDTGLFDATDPAARQLADRILARGGVVMVQPEIEELSRGAEKALYAIDGVLTHAIEKGALLDVGGGLLGGTYVENPVAVAMSAEEQAFAHRALTAVARAGHERPLYARIDIVDSAAFGIVLLEIELVEPALNLHVAPHALAPVVDAILAATAPR